MANRYANLNGANNISDEWQKINQGFDGVEADMDEKPDKSIAKVNDVDMGTDDTLTIEGSTGITISTNPSEKKVIITATGTSTPGPHGPSHNNDGADPIPDLQNVTNDLAAHKADIVASGIAGYARAYTDGNLDTLNKTGWVQGTNMAGSPDLTRFYYVLHVEGFANGVGAYQLAVRNTAGNREMYLRVKASGTWLDWVRIIDETYGDNKYFQQSEYETGTWTPTLQFGGSSTGITYADRFGRYTKIGNMVTCEIDIALSNKGSATGDAQIAGLPYPSASSRPYHNNIGGYAGVALPSGATGMAYYVPNGSPIVTLRAIGDNLALTTAFDDTHFTDASFLRAVFTYFI